MAATLSSSKPAPAIVSGAVAAPDGWRQVLTQLLSRPLVAFALLVCVLLVVIALLAPWLAPYDPTEQHRDALLQPPVWAGGNTTYLFGTDDLGRDMLSRLMHGARISLLMGFLSVFFALVPGIMLGMIAAFYPQRLGMLVMRVMDVLVAIPGLLLAIAIVAALGPGLYHASVAIAVVFLPVVVRLVRASAMAELGKEYVTASRVCGAGPLRLMFSTVLPNCAAPLIVQATLGFSAAILEGAALGFLGLGVQPPYPEWGTMLSTARDYITKAPWMVTLPGLAIMISVLAINLVGDGLRDALDPRLKQQQ